MISVSTYVLKQVKCYQMPVGKLLLKIESSEMMDGTFTVHSFSKIRIRYGAPRCFGDLGRMAIYF